MSVKIVHRTDGGENNLATVLDSYVGTADRRLMPRFNVAAYDAKSDGSTDDWQAITDAIAAAKAAGATGDQGAVVVLPPGVTMISKPIVLPRTGSVPTNVVWLEGSGNRSTILKGTADFPEDRALIEWEDTAKRAWMQRIKGIRLNLPNVSGVMAIHYQPTSKATLAAILNERLQIHLEDLLIEGTNTYHTSLIRLEGNCAYSVFRNLVGDPSPGTWAADCILLDVDATELGGGTAPNGQDDSGINYSTIEGLYASQRKGGYCGLLRGRLNRTAWRTAICNGTVEQACIDISNGFGVQLDNISQEGQGEKGQYKFTNCTQVYVTNFGLGAPNEPTSPSGHGVGDGLILAGVTDSVFAGRPTPAGAPAFNSSSKHAITLDANCKRNHFSGIRLNGSLADEVEDLGSGNTGDFYNVAAGVVEYLGAASVTGARDDGTALASLLTQLAARGIIVDGTTAT